MKSHRIAYKYVDYLVELPRAFDAEIAALDLSEQTEHFWSMGACDPIQSSGMGPLWTVKEVDLPNWASVHRYADDTYGYGCSVRAIMQLDNCDDPAFEKLTNLGGYELDATLALLKVKNFRSSFMASMRAQVDNWLNGSSNYNAPLSPRQLDCVVRAYHIRTR